MKNKKSKNAFTLVEVIITTLIFTIIAVGLAGSFISGLKLWGRAKSRSFFYNNVIISMEKISHELRQAIEIPQIGFEGKAQELSFPTPIGYSINKVTYKFDPETKKLFRGTLALKDILIAKEKETKLTTVFLELDDFSAEYFYFNKQENKYAWKEQFTKDTGKFLAIKLKAKIKDGEFEKVVFLP